MSEISLRKFAPQVAPGGLILYSSGRLPENYAIPAANVICVPLRNRGQARLGEGHERCVAGRELFQFLGDQVANTAQLLVTESISGFRARIPVPPPRFVANVNVRKGVIGILKAAILQNNKPSMDLTEEQVEREISVSHRHNRVNRIGVATTDEITQLLIHDVNGLARVVLGRASPGADSWIQAGHVAATGQPTSKPGIAALQVRSVTPCCDLIRPGAGMR
jgi:hypothetical protein